MGSYEDHLLGGTVDVPSGNVKRLRAACEGLAGVGTAANPVTIQLAAGVYTLDRPLVVPNYCILRGSGIDSTIIQRTSSLKNTSFVAVATLFCDPVLSMHQSQNVRLAHLSVIHSGTSDAANSSTSSTPIAIFTGASRNLSMSFVRAEGSWVGVYDKTDGARDASDNNKPIPSDTIGQSDFQYRFDNCIFIGHSLEGFRQLARREAFFTSCEFICDIRSTDTLSTDGMPAAMNHWEYAVGYYKNCRFLMQTAQTLVYSAQSTEGAASFLIKDTAITDTIAYCDNCTFHLDLSEGDINSANCGGTCVYVGGNNPGGSTLYPSNVFKADNCRFIYGTGTITSAPYICGIYAENQSGTSLAGDVYLNSCTFEDIEGSGGTRRRDVVIPGRLGNAFIRKVELRNCNAQDYDYRAITGSPVWTHANFMTEPNTMNRQFGSVTFASAATAAATLALNYTASAGITDYWVGLEPSANETFWVSAKTNSGFTVNSSNATSAATIKYVVRR